MTQLIPYLAFNGNCREAMTFYQACLGGKLDVQTVGESPIAEQTPAALHALVVHSALMHDGTMLLFASDMMGDEEPVQGNTVTLCLNCRSEDEITTFFANLSEGAQVTEPLRTEFWGATFGQLTDKFGMRWMLNYDHNQPA